MKDKNKEMIHAFEPIPEGTTEFEHELSDEELEGVVGGIYIQDRLKPPTNDAPPIEAPILNPFV